MIFLISYLIKKKVFLSHPVCDILTRFIKDEVINLNQKQKYKTHSNN